MFRRTAILALSVLAVAQLVPATAASLPPPIETGTIEQTTSDGPVRGLWAKVHLDNPAVEILVTAPLADTKSEPAGTEAHLLTVPDWCARNGAALAINANFFSRPLNAPASESHPAYKAGQPVDLVGLSVSEGRIVSRPRRPAGRGEPDLLFLRSDRAVATDSPDFDLGSVHAAVAGAGPTEGGKQPGTLLVKDGLNTGATARVGPKLRHPRTAAGVTRDGRTLILVVVDGRQPGRSVGITLPELADILIGLGAENAVNLDGGGSSSFFYRPASGPVVMNSPSDGTWRPVGNHLGVRLHAQ